MKAQKGAVRWKKVLIAAGVGTAIVLAATTAYANWRRQSGWCAVLPRWE